jgi:hypothetical protein
VLFVVLNCLLKDEFKGGRGNYEGGDMLFVMLNYI